MIARYLDVTLLIALCSTIAVQVFAILLLIVSALANLYLRKRGMVDGVLTSKHRSAQRIYTYTQYIDVALTKATYPVNIMTGFTLVLFIATMAVKFFM